MKIKILNIFCGLVLLAGVSFGRSRISGYCEQGAQTVTTNTVVSTTTVQASYPSCMVTVYITNTFTLATIFQDDLGTVLSNPFTSTNTGYWDFYADNGVYDVNFSNAGIPTPFTNGGQPALDPKRIGGVRYADTFLGADACLQIQAAVADLPGYRGTVDARGFQGVYPCSVNPFGTAQGVTILLGATTYQTVVPWIVPAKSRLIGIGRGDTGSLNSVVEAVPGFPSNSGVINLCSPTFGTPCQGVQVEHLTIDCNNQSGCIGGYNVYAQEESWFKHVMVLNAPNVGIWMDGAPGGVPTYQTQNSGPLEDLEILPGGAATTNTLCIKINSGVISRGIRDVTCNAFGYTSLPTSSISVEDTHVSITNVGIQDFGEGIKIGAPLTGINDSLIYNVECGNTTGNCSPTIHIENNSQNITLIGVTGNNSGGGGNAVVDDCNSITIPNNFVGVGLYAIGLGSCGQQSILTTNNNVNTKIYSPNSQFLSNVTIPGTGVSDGRITLGQGANFRIYRVDSGTPGDTIADADAGGVTIQQQNMTAGPNGGGLYLQGGGVHTSPDVATGIIGAGVQTDGGTSTAHSTTPMFILLKDGNITFYADSGQTGGSIYTPSEQFQISPTGPMYPAIGFGALGTPPNGTIKFCSDCAPESSPCVGGSTGAISKRLNGAWDCR